MITSREAIGNRIKDLREAKGETQADVASILNVKRETVNHWENGVRDLKTEYTVKLAKYFDTTCDYILRGVKAENVDVNLKLGLNDDVIEILSDLQRTKLAYFDKNTIAGVDYNKCDYAISVLYAINILIAKENRSSILREISDFIESRYEDMEVILKPTQIIESISGEMLNKISLITIQNSLIKLKEEIAAEKSKR